MGIILRLFKKKNNNNNAQNPVNQINNNIIETKYRNSKMKIHICGLWENNKNIIDLIFNVNDVDEIGENNEYKVDDFIWVYKQYDNCLLTEEICGDIEKNIEKDKTNELNSIDNHAMLCFGDDNDMDMVLEEFSEINRPRIILITKKITKIKGYGKKYIKNIISEDMTDDELKNYIEISLKEINNYYNEKNEKMNDKNFPINILLTGMRLSGKSTFVNLLLEKLMALESNNTEYGSLKISEYYAFDNYDNENGIRIIDTPGMSENKGINAKTLEAIKDYIKEEEKNKIYFIFFFYNEGSYLGYSDEVLKILNKCKYQTFFIINKSHDISNKGKSQDIKTKIKYLKQRGNKKIADIKNFIQVNLKSTTGKFYGMTKIFDKLEQFLLEKKIVDNKIMNIINNFKNKKDLEKDEIEIINKNDNLKNNNYI